MALTKAPIEPGAFTDFVDKQGRLTLAGLEMLQQVWRQVVAGYVIVPCTASGTNAITLTPTLHEEGQKAYGLGMGWLFEAAATSTGLVTIGLTGLSLLKGYKTDGAAQATTGDVVSGSMYIAFYSPNLDSGAGGFVLK